MAGTFTVGETKIRPGEYHRYENAGSVSLAGATNGIVAGVIQANWGPLNKVVTFDASTDVNSIYGSGGTEDLITAMFKAANTKGYFVRVGNDDGTAGSVTLADSEGADAVTITAKYVGAMSFTVTIRDSLTNTNKRECIIYNGTSTFEKITFEKSATAGEAAALVSAFADSDNFTVALVDGYSATTTLKTVTQSAFTAGTNPTVDTSAYSTALEALEPYTFNVLCVDSEDTAVHALVQAFIDRIYEAGSFSVAVISESPDVDIDTRIANAKAFNDEKVIYVLNGGIDSSGNEWTGYLNAARIGGIIAYVPSSESVTHYVVSGYAELHETLTNTQVETALQSGCIALDLNSSSQVWIEQGINTLVTCASNQDEGWKKIRRVKTRFELMQRVADTVAALIGKVNNNADGRATIIAAGQAIIDTMVAEGKLISGTMTEDESNPASGESAWFIIAVDDLDSIEKLYLTYRFEFAASDDE